MSCSALRLLCLLFRKTFIVTMNLFFLNLWASLYITYIINWQIQGVLDICQKKHQNNNEQCEVAKISYFGSAIAKILAHRKIMLEGFFESKAEGVHENFLYRIQTSTLHASLIVCKMITIQHFIAGCADLTSHCHHWIASCPLNHLKTHWCRKTCGDC